MMFAWIILIVILLLGISGTGQRKDRPAADSAADILRQRLVRGEISQQEYQQMEKMINKV